MPTCAKGSALGTHSVHFLSSSVTFPLRSHLFLVSSASLTSELGERKSNYKNGYDFSVACDTLGTAASPPSPHRQAQKLQRGSFSAKFPSGLRGRTRIRTSYLFSLIIIFCGNSRGSVVRKVI